METEEKSSTGFNIKNFVVAFAIFVITFGLIVLGGNYVSNNDQEDTEIEVKTMTDDKSNGAEKITELKIEDVTVGTGLVAETGKKVSVNYKGTFLNGEEFDSSYSRNEPFSFVLGSGGVIEGWDKGVVGMKVGGKRKLTIPSSLAYGESGAGGVIPPNTDLQFEIELLGVE